MLSQLLLALALHPQPILVSQRNTCSRVVSCPLPQITVVRMVLEKSSACPLLNDNKTFKVMGLFAFNFQSYLDGFGGLVQSFCEAVSSDLLELDIHMPNRCYCSNSPNQSSGLVLFRASMAPPVKAKYSEVSAVFNILAAQAPTWCSWCVPFERLWVLCSASCKGTDSIDRISYQTGLLRREHDRGQFRGEGQG